jgi:hypothetical protein
LHAPNLPVQVEFVTGELTNPVEVRYDYCINGSDTPHQEIIMKRAILLLILVAVGIIPLWLWKPGSVLGQSPDFLQDKAPSKPIPLGEDQDALLREAVLEAVALRRDQILAYLVFDTLVDNLRYAQDGSWATAWLGMLDPETGAPLPAEPGLALAEMVEGRWQVILPDDSRWLEALKELPDSLLNPEEKAAWLAGYEVHLTEAPAAPLGGYLLPWPQGETRGLSRSVGHDVSFPTGSAHFSFDFYKSGQMWNVYASKSGTVWRFKDDIPTCYEYNCGGSVANYIVLRDDTTTPVTYQLYLHLAQNSIPASLKQIGAPVRQGQLVGVADNTGQSWGHHLHYQVHTNALSYWGVAIDITFDDVSINGGRPRVSPADPPYCQPTDVCQTFQGAYVSNNVVTGDFTPPLGEILNPSSGDVITQPLLPLQGFAMDADSGLYSVQFIVRHLNSSWSEVGPPITPIPPGLYIFDYAWDMCADSVPDGPVSVAMRLVDMDGNHAVLAGLKHFIKNAPCQPPPPCTPGPDQVALHTSPSYQGCFLFSPGDYSTPASLGGLGDNRAASIQVGVQVQATLYMDSAFKLRGETFTASDANLADNLIGSGTLSSLRVALRSQSPAVPLVDPLQNPGAQVVYGDVVTLVWENAGGAQEYQVEYSDSGIPALSAWVPAPYLSLPGLQNGAYTWRVRARNESGTGSWSTSLSFTVNPEVPTAAPTFTAPYTDGLESPLNWTKTGIWNHKTEPLLAHSGTGSWWHHGAGPDGDYDRDGRRTWSDLTSPPISIPSAGYYLRFFSRNETEGSGLHWDQRWVQISANDGPFYNILQLSDDPRLNWLQSPYIDLSAYAGQTIRVRFRFDTIDYALNATRGWGIDDLRITQDPPPACSSGEPQNGSPDQAALISYGEQITAHICPPGDVDYYRFAAAAGDRIAIDIDAHRSGSTLDPILYLFDSDGTSLLAEHDDRLLGVDLDPLIGFQIERSGEYFIKVKSWDHPSSGSPLAFYRLSLYQDSQPPQLTVHFPQSSASLPDLPIQILTSVSDALSGISHVEYLWHDSNWLDSPWKSAALDYSGCSVCAVQFSPPAAGDKTGIALFVRAYDLAGNTAMGAVWNLDFTGQPFTTYLPVVRRR